MPTMIAACGKTAVQSLRVCKEEWWFRSRSSFLPDGVFGQVAVEFLDRIFAVFSPTYLPQSNQLPKLRARTPEIRHGLIAGERTTQGLQYDVIFFGRHAIQAGGRWLLRCHNNRFSYRIFWASVPGCRNSRIQKENV